MASLGLRSVCGTESFGEKPPPAPGRHPPGVAPILPTDVDLRPRPHQNWDVPLTALKDLEAGLIWVYYCFPSPQQKRLTFTSGTLRRCGASEGPNSGQNSQAPGLPGVQPRAALSLQALPTWLPPELSLGHHRREDVLDPRPWAGELPSLWLSAREVPGTLWGCVPTGPLGRGPLLGAVSTG